MGKYVCEEAIENNIYKAFDCFKIRFLKEHKSIFSDDENKVLTKHNIELIIEKFINKPDESLDKNFDEKIKGQLGEDADVHKLFAHIIWLWSIFASDMKKESKKEDINKWLPSNIQIDNESDFLFDHGIGSTGQYHKTNKPRELAFIIRFLDKVLDDNREDYEVVIKDGVMDGMAPQEMRLGRRTKKVAMYNILLHLFKPEEYERIASYGHKEKIVSFFESQYEDINPNSEEDLDERIKKIRERLNNEHKDSYPFLYDVPEKKEPFNVLDFYHSELERLWKDDIVLESKNMILHGAPGTGKTFSVESSIKNRLEFLKNQNASEQFVLVQFHPSYSYEDFIDGIKPDGIDKNGNLRFSLVNGEFKKMCIAAFKELKAHKNDSTKAKKYYFVADEINRAELSRVFGELLLCLEEDKRLRFEKDKLVGTKVKTQNSSLWQEEHAVVVDDGKYYFGVPENLYFIGTMNDIDRSVDSFDMALRRRFFWKHYTCDYDVIMEKFSDKQNVDTYLNICKKLNAHITTDRGFNLGPSYQLGHAYFMRIDRINKIQVDRLWENHISPLLKEYLRAEQSENEIENSLKDAKNIFTLK